MGIVPTFTPPSKICPPSPAFPGHVGVEHNPGIGAAQGTAEKRARLAEAVGPTVALVAQRVHYVRGILGQNAYRSFELSRAEDHERSGAAVI